VEGRAMDVHKQAFAQSEDSISDWRIAGPIPTTLEVIQNTSATVLLGLSGQTGAFNQPIVTAMCQNTVRPVIFALSNPTSVCEALPEDIVKWSDGRAIVATGSPFPDVNYKGSMYSIGQGNNAFIFPGLGFAAILSKCREITDNMVLEAAYALADYTAAKHLDAGLVYPPIRELQEVSVRVAVRVIRCALKDGVTGNTTLEGRDLDAYVRSRFFKPRYLPFVRGQ
jgi:malate dehydrogenase (oxaloacetate-decarboxylating)